MADLIRKPVAWALGALLLIGLAWWLVASLTGGKAAQVEARLQRGRADAAIASGQDAVTTVGAAADREAAAAELTRTNQQEIHDAPGAAVPVSAEASAAGLAALCRRAAYAHDPRCLRRQPADR